MVGLMIYQLLRESVLSQRNATHSSILFSFCSASAGIENSQKFVSEFDMPSGSSSKNKDASVLETGRPFSPAMFEGVL
ncbi:unnamed protein product [Prunus armeniaca]